MVDAHGSLRRYGTGGAAPTRIRFTSARAERNVLLSPDLKVGEEYMRGGLVVEQGTIYDLLAIVLGNLKGDYPSWLRAGTNVGYLLRRLHQINTPRRARRNVNRHYDLDRRLFSLFLDSDLQYSCAYFETDHSNLEEAQLAKKRHLASKLHLKDGQRLLDIGSGWGGLALYLAECADAEVVGVTLSEEQLTVATQRAAERGLDRRVKFLLRDYREIDGPFDRIVSVGMFEHVGLNHYRAFFNACRDLLSPDGVMLLHSIGRSFGPSYTNAWVQKYVFPGGYIPALSEVAPEIEDSGLGITDVEVLRLHYAKTLRLWRERFAACRDQAVALYDERFCRMWEFYLAVSEAAFRFQGMVNFQIQLVRKQTALPLTRDYMAEAEEHLRSIGGHRSRRTREVGRERPPHAPRSWPHLAEDG